ncbi:MAG: hypothetical protein Q7T60_17205 [Sphingopyxis sp.]|nr:hypothetical protein [Sphingopyxis sp.]
MALLWNPVPIPVFNPSTGERAGGAKAYFYVGGTTSPLAVYTTDAATTPHTHPVIADASGVFPPIFIPYGPFGYRVTSSTGATISPTVATVQNPAPPDSGGGGGIIVTQDQILQPGDTMWRLQGGVRSGWVRMNDLTIGNAGSGATERANSDTEAAFAFLYNNCSNAVAPVSGGRTTVSADFAANKTIVIPTMQGIIAGGLDDMGGTVANRVQRSTTISTTNTSTSATVASAIGLVIGMTVVSANVQAGTTITAISGTSITLSLAASATAAGTAARFSMFSDAQVVGSVGGVAQQAVLERELPAITPSGFVSVSVNSPLLRTNNGTGLNGAMGGLAFTSAGSNSTGLISTEPVIASGSFAGTSFGGNLASSRIQPTRLGSWYLKL